MMLCLQGTTLQANGLTADSAIVEWLKSTFDIKFTDNNRVVVFRTGQEKFDDMFETIRQARHSVHLEYFNFRNDSISNALFDLLKQKVSEGVAKQHLPFFRVPQCNVSQGKFRREQALPLPRR